MPRFSILYYTMSYGIIFHSSILYYPFYQTNLTREDRDAPTRDDWVVTPGAGYLRRYQDHCLCRTAEEQTIVTEMSRVNSMTIAEIIKILEVAENSDPSGSSAT